MQIIEGEKYSIIKGLFIEQFINQDSSYYLEHIFIPNYYKYPQEACLQLSFQEFSKIANTLPEDIYFFDDDFDWCIAMTHEDDGKRRYCLSIGCQKKHYV